MSKAVGPLSSPNVARPVSAGIGTTNGSGMNIGNSPYTVGFYPYQHDSNYVRSVAVASGNLINTGSCFRVNDVGIPVLYHVIENDAMAVSNYK